VLENGDGKERKGQLGEQKSVYESMRGLGVGGGVWKAYGVAMAWTSILFYFCEKELTGSFLADVVPVSTTVSTPILTSEIPVPGF
jgi:hypothetical protein